MDENLRLNSWLVIDAPYGSREQNKPENDPPGYQRVHWEDVLKSLVRAGAQISSTMPDTKDILQQEPQVVIIQGHSSIANPEKAIYLTGTGRAQIHPRNFPSLKGCRLLWLDTCFGDVWLESGLRERLDPGTIVVSTSAAKPDAYAGGAGAISDLANRWPGGRQAAWQPEVLLERVSEAVNNIPDTGNHPQNLIVSVHNPTNF